MDGLARPLCSREGRRALTWHEDKRVVLTRRTLERFAGGLGGRFEFVPICALKRDRLAYVFFGHRERSLEGNSVPAAVVARCILLHPFLALA